MMKRFTFAIVIVVASLSLASGCRVVTPQQDLRSGIYFFPPTCPQICK